MIYSNDYIDLMVNYIGGEAGAEEIYRTGCVNPLLSEIAIVHIPRGEDYLYNLEFIPYSFIPKPFGLMDSSNLEPIGAKAIQNGTGVGLRGAGVIVGIIDTGIDYQNSLFRGLDGRTRIGMIWDQTIENGNKSEDLPTPFFGATFSSDEINEALQAENPLEIVASTDTNGHGTFMAGIAAGGADRANDFTGIATEAEIAVVKVKQAKPYLKEYFGISQDTEVYAESDIMYAINYLLKFAQARGKVLSICIGFGSNNGGHLGLTSIERYLSLILDNVGPMVSAPAGNEGTQRTHYFGSMEEDEKYHEVEINIAQGQEALSIEIWGEVPTTFALGITSPQGDNIEKIPPRFGKEEIVRLPLSKTSIYVAYQLVETYSGEQLIFVRLNNPIPGIWRFRIYGDSGKRRVFNMWLPLRQFMQKDTYFLQSTPENTITVPGNAPLVMTMTAYNHLNGSIYSEAGRGYNSRNQVKPDLAAPGVNVFGPGRNNNYVRRSGTSVAAAHCAGVMAQFLEWTNENRDIGLFYANQIQGFFLKSAVRNPDLQYPNPIWGYGILNIESVFVGFSVVDN